GRRPVVDGDQVIIGEKNVLFVAFQIPAGGPAGAEEDHEPIAVVVLQLRPLAMLGHILDGQRVELESLAEKLQVLFAGGLDVHPEALEVTALQVLERRLGVGLVERPLGRDQRAHGRDPKPAASTESYWSVWQQRDYHVRWIQSPHESDSATRGQMRGG